jgi:hydrogenase-4 component B
VTPGVLFLTGALALIAGIILGPRWPRVWIALMLIGVGAGIGAALQVLAGGSDWDWRSVFLIAGEPLHVRLDPISAFFMVPLCVVGGVGAVYSREYWPDQQYPASAPLGRMWWSGLVLNLGFVLLASHGLQFLIGWELFTLSAYFLVTLDRQRRGARDAGWLYLAASHVGTLCLFAFFASLAANTGSWELGPMRERTELAPLFWLALVGFGVKGGLFPLHVWLPSAHANAPSHVSAIMSGVAIKMGIYGYVRFTGWLPVPAAAGWIVIGMGGVAAVLGIAFALAQNDLKRLLAYSSVENIGVIVIGLGGALLGRSQDNALWGRLALAGALLHVWNHALFKSLLFFGAGSVLHATHTRELSRLGGLWRSMPWTAGLFTVGALAICGLPPLNGFVSEWLVYLGLVDAASGRGSAAWAAMPAAILLAITGTLALATFVKAGAVTFLGAPRTKAAAHAHESGPLMRGSMLTLAAGCLAIGLAPIVFWSALARAVQTWQPIWSGPDLPAPLSTLSAFHVVLAVVAAVAAFLIWRKAHANGLRRALTWDCGYAAPTARMQYTSGSFAALAGGWFSWILQPERAVRRPRGPFPSNASRMERIPESVLERMIVPAAEVILRLSTATRRLQHGRLQFYIVYVVVGLAAIATLVCWDATS